MYVIIIIKLIYYYIGEHNMYTFINGYHVILFYSMRQRVDRDKA